MLGRVQCGRLTSNGLPGRHLPRSEFGHNLPRMMLSVVKCHWPILCAALLFLLLVVCVRPWSELPLHDDWLYSHVARTFAEHGSLPLDLATATVVGQSVMAWPIVQIFGFSHLALRLLTIGLSILMLVEVNYLLALGAVSAGVRFVTLCALGVNPIFMHLATTFMTENYGFFVALLAACIWFRGRNHDSAWPGVIAAAIVGFSFWIRQFCALVFPALLLAEWIVAGASLKSMVALARKRALAIVVWTAFIAVYFAWAKATGNYSRQFSQPLGHMFPPDPVAIVVELGIYLFYLTFFFAPFLVGYGRLEKPSITGWIIFFALALTAALAWKAGSRTGPPSVPLNSVFPFLNDVFANYGIGPITFTDFYWDSVNTRPRTPELPWLVLEVCTIVVSLAWVHFARRVRQQMNEIGVFGICLAVLSFIAVVLTYRYSIFDRYHYPGILGFSLALGAFFPRQNGRRLNAAALVCISGLAAFSTLSLHDYFRWQEARWALLTKAQQSRITLSTIDAGFEPNAWYTLEGMSSACGQLVAVSCRSRPYHVGLEQLPSDSLIFFQPIDAWFVRFPNVKLLGRR